MDRSTEIFEKMPIRKAVWTLCLPNILSMLTSILYNLVDIYFVGRTGDPNQVAAVSLCAPIFTILMGIGNIFGIGGGTYLSRTLGEGRRDRVKKITSFSFWTSVVIGILAAVIMVVSMTPLLKVLGTSAGTETYCRQYLMWIGLGSPVVILSFTLSNLIRSEGGAKETMVGTMMGTITNIILDPIMIFGLRMGVVGAAAATVIGNIVSDVYYLIYILRKSTTQSLAPKDFSAGWKTIVWPILLVGVPASLTNLMSSIAMVLLNNEMLKYGDKAIAGLGIATKVNSMAFLLLIAIAFGVQPLMGFCYGAKNRKRFREALRYTVLCQVVVGTVGMVVVEVLAGPLVKIFISDPEVVTYGEYILRAMNVTGPVIGILFLLTNLFQSMGKGIPSVVLSLSRQGIIYIPVLILMSRLWKYNGVVFAQPVADLIALTLAILFYVAVQKKDQAAGA